MNDDPSDSSVCRIIEVLNDQRIQLFKPVDHRGAAANFNLAFAECHCEFSAILEDDNWWEPEFLAAMLEALRLNPTCAMAVGNETIWREQADGQWLETGATVWPETKGFSEWSTPFDFACGSAKLCNSSMVFRTIHSSSWQTPDDIPVDVTEHFRERCVPQPVLLVHEPLVNYAETLATNRSVKGTTWSDYQCLLIGSCFYLLTPALRHEYARSIWKKVGGNPSPRATLMLLAALAVPERAVFPLRQRPRNVFVSFSPCFAGRADLPCAECQKQVVRAHWDYLCAHSIDQKCALSNVNAL